MFVSGSDIIDSSFWGGTSAFLDSCGGNLDPAIGCYMPTTPATWDNVARIGDTNGYAAPRQETVSGTRVTLPVGYFRDGLGNAFIGVLRQIRRSQDAQMGQIIQDSAAADQSFIIAGSSTTNVDAASFDNS